LRYVFLTLLAHNGDTNVVKRGGIEALDWLQGRARHILADPAALRQPEALYAALKTLDAQCTEKNLSTGGSADLLALTIWLTEYPNLLGTSYEPT
jgi:triphosphoribosyl-dephospho-CoA synthetase